MGIKGFRGWFESTFPDSMTPINTSPSNHLKVKQEQNKKKNQPVLDSETFDHVLIDVNQLLHVSLRRARNEGHALTMVIKELDKCLHLAKPTKSVVLALDGPPSAAKLATQRRRRYGLVARAALKRERRKLLENRIQKVNDASPQEGHENNKCVTSTSSSSANMLNLLLPNRKRKQRYRINEEQTLCITPGTAFMDRAADAILYWTWQRLTNPTSLLRRHQRNVKVYLSTSDSPGEGEVKLLDWVFQLGSQGGRQSINKREQHPNGISISTRNKRQVIKPGDSIAIMGGDSDLVLEGLILPPSITHNVFVILPDGNKKSYSVSLWQTTLELLKYLPQGLTPNSVTSTENSESKNIAPTNNITYPWSEEDLIMNVRTDLVLLLILNGNDYLPKLRGSSGFNKLFHTYLKLLRQWLDLEEKKRDSQSNNGTTPLSSRGENLLATNRPFLINRETLSFNIPFCLAFFRQLARKAPKFIESSNADLLSYSGKANYVTPLGVFNNMMEQGLFPKPAVWSVIERNPKIGINQKPSSKGKASRKRRKNEREEYVQVTLGDTNSETSPHYTFEMKHEQRTSLKTTKHRVASLAMAEILGSDWKELNDYYFDEDIDDEDTDETDEDGDEDVNDDVNDDINDDGLDFESERGMISSSGYAWEVSF